MLGVDINRRLIFNTRHENNTFIKTRKKLNEKKLKILKNNCPIFCTVITIHRKNIYYTIIDRLLYCQEVENVGVGSFQIAPIHKFWMPICYTYSNLNKLYMTTGSHWWVSARKTNTIANALELRLSCTNPLTYNLYSKVLVTSSRGIGQGINESRCSRRSSSTCAICVLRFDRKLKCVNVTFTLVSPRMTQSPLHTHTPLVESYPLGKLMGCRVWLKLDNLQPVDSFKIRGIGNRVQKVDN